MTANSGHIRGLRGEPKVAADRSLRIATLKRPGGLNAAKTSVASPSITIEDHRQGLPGSSATGE